jgi:hypothetical protein
LDGSGEVFLKPESGNGKDRVAATLSFASFHS